MHKSIFNPNWKSSIQTSHSKLNWKSNAKENQESAQSCHGKIFAKISNAKSDTNCQKRDKGDAVVYYASDLFIISHKAPSEKYK